MSVFRGEGAPYLNQLEFLCYRQRTPRSSALSSWVVLLMWRGLFEFYLTFRTFEAVTFTEFSQIREVDENENFMEFVGQFRYNPFLDTVFLFVLAYSRVDLGKLR
jgi:hypothetical protein